uniref:At1g61320/AtMIF1 LRR domain-containing protein n=1 Tax=Aegilops tauschii subsp. strangulata TaxID=200361 RepID=A0A453J5R5_AEGTS
MGLLALKMLMSRRRDSKHLCGQIQARNRLVTSVVKRKISSCQHNNNQGCKRVAFSGADLPEVSQDRMKHDSVLGDPSSRLRQMPEYRHDNIKNVRIIGFCSAKSMVELACHILENATSLECLTLDTIRAFSIDRHIHKTGECGHIGRHMIREARKALLAVKRYIVGIVPSTVKLNVLQPCKLCHALAA